MLFRSFKKVMELEPDHQAARFHTGVLLIRTGNVDKGVKMLHAVMNADPESTFGKQAVEEIKQINEDRFRGIPKQTLRTGKGTGDAKNSKGAP